MADIVRHDVIRIAWEEADEDDKTPWSYAITAEVKLPGDQPYSFQELRFSVGESESSFSRLESSFSRLEIYASDIPRYIELLQAIQEYIDTLEVTDEHPV